MGEYYSGGGIYAYGAGTTVEITGGEISGNSCANRGDAVSLYGSGSNSYPTLKLSGSPTIFGDIFLWDGEDEGPVIQIVDEFAPAVPVPVAATYRTEGTAAVSYMNGLIPDASQFASTEESMGLIQSGQDLIWIKKYSVAFKDETDKMFMQGSMSCRTRRSMNRLYLRSARLAKGPDSMSPDGVLMEPRPCGTLTPIL
ncbi:MAG: hypothetical protein ACLR23_16025 [Clostridia bacterium]